MIAIRDLFLCYSTHFLFTTFLPFMVRRNKRRVLSFLYFFFQTVTEQRKQMSIHFIVLYEFFSFSSKDLIAQLILFFCVNGCRALLQMCLIIIWKGQNEYKNTCKSEQILKYLKSNEPFTKAWNKAVILFSSIFFMFLLKCLPLPFSLSAYDQIHVSFFPFKHLNR